MKDLLDTSLLKDHADLANQANTIYPARPIPVSENPEQATRIIGKPDNDIARQVLETSTTQGLDLRGTTPKKVHPADIIETIDRIDTTIEYLVEWEQSKDNGQLHQSITITDEHSEQPMFAAKIDTDKTSFKPSNTSYADLDQPIDTTTTEPTTTTSTPTPDSNQDSISNSDSNSNSFIELLKKIWLSK